MRKRNWIIAGAAVVVAAAAGYGLFIYPDQAVRSALDAMTRKMPAGATFTYKDAHYSILHRTLTLDGLFIHFRIAGEPPNGANIAIQSLTVEHPSTSAADRFAKLRTDPASITPQTRIPIADAMILTGVKLWTDVAPLSSRTDWLGIYKLSVYPWVLLHAGLPAFEKMQKALASDAPSPEALPILQFYAAMILGLRYDAYVERNLYVTLPRPAGTPYSDIPLVLGTEKLDARYKLGTQSNATLDGFTVRAKPYGTLASAHVELPDFNIRETLLRLINGDSLGPAAEKMKIGPMKFSGVSIARAGQAAIPLGDTVLSKLHFDQGRLVSGAAAMNSFRMAGNELCQWLGEIACTIDPLPEQVTVSWRAAFTRDLGRDRLSVSHTRIEIDKLGSATLNADFVDIAHGASFMEAARLAHAELRIHGSSLVGRFLATSGRPGGTEAGGALQWVAMVVKAQGATAADPPHDLKVVLSPTVPVPLDRLRAASAVPGDTPPDLGLTVSTVSP
jgi:hypothetical protein